MSGDNEEAESFTRMAQKRKDTLVRQKEIVDAARKLVVKHGSEHVTSRRIAAEIGISESAIYRHFKSKRDILSLLVVDIENTWIADLKRGSASGLGPLDTLESVLLNHVSSIEQRKGVSFQVIAEIISLGDKKLNKQVSVVIYEYLAGINALLAEGIEAGEIRLDIDLEAAAMLFFGMVQGLVNIWALDSYSFDVQEKYRPLWNTFRDAVAAKAERQPAAAVRG